MTKTEKIDVQPQEIQDVGTQNVDLQKITEASKKITSNAIAKILVLGSIGPAYFSRIPDLMMQDQEALGFAIPSTTILFRYGWFQKFYKQYGHYLNNTDEYYMLSMAAYMYGSRVKMAIDRQQQRKRQEGELTGRIRETGNAESSVNGGSAGPIPTIGGWRSE